MTKPIQTPEEDQESSTPFYKMTGMNYRQLRELITELSEVTYKEFNQMYDTKEEALEEARRRVREVLPGLRGHLMEILQKRPISGGELCQEAAAHAPDIPQEVLLDELWGIFEEGEITRRWDKSGMVYIGLTSRLQQLESEE